MRPALLAVLLALPAHAAGGASVSFEQKASDQPVFLVIAVKEKAKRLTVTLERSDGETVVRRFDRPRGRVRFELPQPQGRFEWTGRLEVTFADGSEGTMPLTLTTVVQGPLTLRTQATRQDVLGRRVVLVPNRAVVRATVVVQAPGGVELAREEQTLTGEPPYTIGWAPMKGEVASVKITLFDDAGAYNGVEFFPWSVSIPHDDVEFQTGQAAIRPDEAPKLVAVLDEMRAVIAKYGSTGDAQLWIAGHTDTVGSPETNQALSERRAAAIARWFAKQGVQVPIHYRGFGEQAPAVATPDETDEAKNRRAEYVVAAEDPYAGRDLPGAWRRLR